MSKNALIGSLSILTQVDTGKLSSGVKDTEKQVGGLVQRLTGLGGSLLNLQTLSAAGIGYKLWEGFDKLDGLTATAAKLGITAQSLQELQHVAAMTDVNFEKLSVGVGKAQKTLGDALLGNKTAAESFKDLGLDIERLRGLSATELFGAIAGQLATVEDEATRASLAAGVFGAKMGSEFNPIIEQGREGVARLAAEARKLGLVLSDEQARNVAAANDEWDRFKQTIDGTTAQMLGDLAPALQVVFGAGGWLVNKFAIGLQAISAGFFTVLGGAAKALGYLSETADDVGDKFLKMALDSSEAMDRMIAGTNEADDATKRLGATAIDSAAAARQAWETAWQEMADGAAKTIAQTDATADELWRRWQNDLETLNMTPREAEIHELKNKGLTPEQERQLDHQRRIVEEKEHEKKVSEELAEAEKRRAEESKRDAEREKERLADRLRQLKEEAMTEKEKREARQQELNDAFMRGDLPAEEFLKLTERNKPDRNALPFAGAALAGSNEARETLLRASARGDRGPWEGLAKNSAESLDVQREMAKTLRSIDKNKPAVAGV